MVDSAWNVEETGDINGQMINIIFTTLKAVPPILKI